MGFPSGACIAGDSLLQKYIYGKLAIDGKLFVGCNEPLYPVGADSTTILHVASDVIIERTDGFSPQIKFKTNAFASQNGLIAFKDLSDNNQWTVQARSSNHVTEPKEFSISNQYNGGTWYTPFVLMPEVCNRMFVVDEFGVTMTKDAGAQIKLNSDGVNNSGILIFRDSGDDENWMVGARSSDHASAARQFKLTEYNQGSTWYDPFTIYPTTPTDSLVMNTDGVHFNNELLIDSPTVPAAANSTGVTGTIAWDSGFIYVCVATDTWKRTAIGAW